MRTISLFELFLLLFAYYPILNFEGSMGILLSLLCLVTVFLFERLQRRRRFYRYSTRLIAQYFLEGMASDWKECNVITVARKGMGIVFHTKKKIDVGSTINLAITAPGEEEPITVKGTLRWIKKSKKYFVGGIEFADFLDTDRFVKLSLRYSWEY